LRIANTSRHCRSEASTHPEPAQLSEDLIISCTGPQLDPRRHLESFPPTKLPDIEQIIWEREQIDLHARVEVNQIEPWVSVDSIEGHGFTHVVVVSDRSYKAGNSADIQLDCDIDVHRRARLANDRTCHWAP
jgi:hypothetical protein